MKSNGIGSKYSLLPRTIIISIVAFPLFDCAEFHSEFQLLEVTRHTPLTDRQVLHYFELPKLPEKVDADDGLKLWLTLFKAETEEDLAKIEAMEVSVMTEAIGAYRHVTATDEFKEIERLRSRARHNEASALSHARDEGRAEGQIKSVMAVLEIRFGDIPSTLRKNLLHVRDDGRIEVLLKQAATCQSLKEFQKAL
jgi:predicted transposase/invertase (TIGR01784 family)